VGYDAEKACRLRALVAELRRGVRHRGLVVAVVRRRPLVGDLVFVIRSRGVSFEPWPIPDRGEPGVWVVGVVVVRAPD
jgi:hypothetical protein